MPSVNQLSRMFKTAYTSNFDAVLYELLTQTVERLMNPKRKKYFQVKEFCYHIDSKAWN